MFYAAAQNKDYQCFLSEDTALPMMHIDDLIDGTVLSLMILLDFIRSNTWKPTQRNLLIESITCQLLRLHQSKQS